MQMPEQIRLMYRRMGEVFTTSGGQVPCLFDVADRTAFDAVIVGDYTLRYLSADATLERDELVSIHGFDYAVVAPPERINVYESVAQLMREP